MTVPTPNDPVPPVSPAATQRGYRHWTIIGIGVSVLIIVFLVSR